MTMSNVAHDPIKDIPSKQKPLLFGLIGRRIVRMVRYCWSAADEALAEYGIAAHELFELGPGPISLYFESGTVIGAGSQPSLSSVIVWLERDEHGALRDDPMADDPELHAIAADDSRNADSRWAATHGARVTAIRVLAPHEQSEYFHSSCVNQIAVRFELDNGDSFYLGHGLHDGSDDFAVLHAEGIDPAIQADLRELFTLDAMTQLPEPRPLRTADFSPEVPSQRRALLSDMLGERLVGIVRYSRLPIDPIAPEYALERNDLFQNALGPVALLFESEMIVGVGDDPPSKALRVWLEQHETGQTRATSLHADPRLAPMEAGSPLYVRHWGSATWYGTRIVSISAFTRIGTASSDEIALQLRLDDGKSLVMGRCLRPEGDDFAVFLNERDIPPERRAALHESFRLDKA